MNEKLTVKEITEYCRDNVCRGCLLADILCFDFDNIGPVDWDIKEMTRIVRNNGLQKEIVWELRCSEKLGWGMKSYVYPRRISYEKRRIRESFG